MNPILLNILIYVQNYVYLLTIVVKIFLVLITFAKRHVIWCNFIIFLLVFFILFYVFLLEALSRRTSLDPNMEKKPTKLRFCCNLRGVPKVHTPPFIFLYRCQFFTYVSFIFLSNSSVNPSVFLRKNYGCGPWKTKGSKKQVLHIRMSQVDPNWPNASKTTYKKNLEKVLSSFWKRVLLFRKSLPEAKKGIDM